MHVFFSVGEPSGDQHAAQLIAELKRRRPEIVFSGFGGPLMEQQGCRLVFELTTLAVMGIFRVIPMLLTFYRLVKQAEAYLRDTRPDAVVLVDFPGFNWWIARKAKRLGIPVIYYLPPQLWAWAPWRIQRVRKFVDHVLSGLAFEVKWYADHGVQAEYVGHPFFDEVAGHQLDPVFCRTWSDGVRNVALLPGSRNHEVTRNWPVLLGVARRLAADHPNVRFMVPCYKEKHREFCRDEWQKTAPELPLHFFVGKTSEVIELAECALMVSGSVSLEMLARNTPTVVVYRVGLMTYLLGRVLITCRYMSLPNLMAGRLLMPEFVVMGNMRRVEREASGILHRWLGDTIEMQHIQEELTDLRNQVYATGATSRAADAILARLPGETARQAA